MAYSSEALFSFFNFFLDIIRVSLTRTWLAMTVRALCTHLAYGLGSFLGIRVEEQWDMAWGEGAKGQDKGNVQLGWIMQTASVDNTGMRTGIVQHAGALPQPWTSHYHAD